MRLPNTIKRGQQRARTYGILIEFLNMSCLKLESVVYFDWGMENSKDICVFVSVSMIPVNISDLCGHPIQLREVSEGPGPAFLENTGGSHLSCRRNLSSMRGVRGLRRKLP